MLINQKDQILKKSKKFNNFEVIANFFNIPPI